MKDGSSLRVAVLKAPENPSAPDTTYRVKFLEDADEGKEVAIPVASVAERTPVPGVWTTIGKAKWWIVVGVLFLLALILTRWLGVMWWKIALAAVPPLVLTFAWPSDGPGMLLPFSAGIVAFSLVLATERGEGEEWFSASLGLAKQILPLLLLGVFVAGFLLGRPEHKGLIPSRYVQMWVGDTPEMFFVLTGIDPRSFFASGVQVLWPLWTNLFASVFGAFMYFATLTEVPILQGLIGAGMGKGPALALLLVGPALSLPNILVIRSIMGT